jgi:hypothetical protein
VETVRFHAKVGLVRLLRWLACHYPLPLRPEGPPVDPLTLPGRPDLLVAPSLIPNAGLGLFAGRAFAKGELICFYTGIRLTTLEALRTPDWRYMVALGKNRQGERVWIDARPTLHVVARYINHQFDPARRNVETMADPDEARWRMVASRPIAAGEEFYYDYGPHHWHCFDRGLGPDSYRRRPPRAAPTDIP